MGWFPIYRNTDLVAFWGGGKVSRKGIAPSMLGYSTVNFICGSMELRKLSIMSLLPQGMILKTSSTYLFHSLMGMGVSGPNAKSSKYSM